MTRSVSIIGKEIKRRRKLLRWTQTQLANESGVSNDVISQLETGVTDSPSGNRLAKLAKALGCTAEDLGRPGGNTKVRRPANDNLRIDELDVRAGMGNALNHDADEPERVVAQWELPPEMLRGQTTATAQNIRIITVYGDSMVPDFQPGDRVMVDTSDRIPSPPGVFVIFDGLGIVVKRIEYVAYSDPPVVRLISRNKEYDPQELPADEVVVNGRVIGKWHWT